MVNLNIDTLLVSNKPEDKASLSWAHLSVAKLETHNSSIVWTASILLSNWGFLDIQNLFSHSLYIEEASKTLLSFSWTNLLTYLFINGVCLVLMGYINASIG